MLNASMQKLGNGLCVCTYGFEVAPQLPMDMSCFLVVLDLRIVLDLRSPGFN
jgi:hypothetical protein